MWMRFAQAGPFRHVPETLGVFFDSPNTLSGATNRWQMDTESLNIKLTYLTKAPWLKSKKLRSSLANALFSTGYWYIEHAKDSARAKPFLKAAWTLDPLNPSLAKTYLLRGVFGSTVRVGRS